MKPSRYRGAPSFICPGCSGTWIGGDSLHDIITVENDFPVLQERFEALFDLDFEGGKRTCPACVNRTLKAVEVEGTEIDFCSRCKGLFFDKGELEEVFLSEYETANDDAAEAQDAETESFWAALFRFIGGSR
jgi:Zn-finger nucleic acid-binding protein